MTAATTTEPVGALLRGWRERRRLSQLELAARAEVSTRHLSCVETGKAKPTAAMIDRLAEHLDVPLRERNGLLLAGGYAPRYGARTLDDADLAPVLAGLRALLDAHNPFPAMLLDDGWDLVDANAAAYRLIGELCDPALLEPPANVLRISLHPKGLGRFIRNKHRWAASVHSRVRHRAERTGDPRLAALADEIATYADPHAHLLGSPEPVLALELDVDGRLIRCYGVASQLETATDVTLAELHLETFVPADAATAAWLGARAQRD